MRPVSDKRWEFLNLVVSKWFNQAEICNAETLFCALLHSLALFCTLALVLFCIRPKKPLTHVLNVCLGSTERRDWRGVGGKGWRRVGERLAKGWRRVGEGLAKGWQTVGGFPCTLQFCNSRNTSLAERVGDFIWTVSNATSADATLVF